MKRETGKNYIRQIQGQHSREAGRQFEGIIEAACNFYSEHDIAQIEKTPEPMRPLRPVDDKGHFLACFEKKAQPDFKGCWADGRCICFEAKHTETGEIKYSAVTQEQEKKLDKYAKMRAECFVVVSFGFFTFHKIPWGVWKNMKQIFGRKYIKPEEIAQYRIKFKYGILDFLGKADDAKILTGKGDTT